MNRQTSLLKHKALALIDDGHTPEDVAKLLLISQESRGYQELVARAEHIELIALRQELVQIKEERDIYKKCSGLNLNGPTYLHGTRFEAYPEKKGYSTEDFDWCI